MKTQLFKLFGRIRQKTLPKTKLKEFYNTKIGEIKEEINKLAKTVTNKAIQIKLNEVANLLSPLGKTVNVGDDELVNLLQYYALLEELVNSNG